MSEEDEIIVLHYTVCGDNTLVLHVLSRNDGRCALLVRGAGKNISFFQPLNILECMVSANPKSSLSAASKFHSRKALNGLRSSYGKGAISMFLAEVLYRSIREGMKDDGLYDWCIQEILLLDSLEGDFANFHIRFLLDYAAASGFGADYDKLLPFMEEDAADIAKFLRCSWAEAMFIPLKGGQRSTICRKLIRYLEFHLEVPLNIRSLSVLGELF